VSAVYPYKRTLIDATGVRLVHPTLLYLEQILNRDDLILSADQVTIDEHKDNSRALLKHLHAAKGFLSHAREKQCQHDTECKGAQPRHALMQAAIEMSDWGSKLRPRMVSE
jgi:hypothetical protein